MDPIPNSSYKRSIKAMHYFNCPLNNFWDISQSASLFFILLESIARETLIQLSTQHEDELFKKLYFFCQTNYIQYNIIKTFNSDYCIREQWQCSIPVLNKPYFVSFDVFSISQELCYLIIAYDSPFLLIENQTNNEQKIRKEELTKINTNILLGKYLPTQSEIILIEGDFNLALSLLIRKEICQTFIEQKKRSLTLKIPIISQIVSLVSYTYYSKLKIDYEDKDIHCTQIQIAQINKNELYIILTHYFFVRSSYSIQEKYTHLTKMFISNFKKTFFELNLMNKSKQNLSNKLE